MEVTIRREKPEDIELIHQMLEQAFEGSEEAGLVKALRDNGKIIISLVAQVNNEIAGHILFSPLSIEKAANDIKAAGLAPVAVAPKYQKKGIGSKLIKAGMKECKKAGCDVIAVLGSPGYYSRFGFKRAIDYGITNEYGVTEEFMVSAFEPTILKKVSGLARYQPEFGKPAEDT